LSNLILQKKQLQRSKRWMVQNWKGKKFWCSIKECLLQKENHATTIEAETETIIGTEIETETEIEIATEIAIVTEEADLQKMTNVSIVENVVIGLTNVESLISRFKLNDLENVLDVENKVIYKKIAH